MAKQTKYGIKLATDEYKPERKKILALSKFESGNVLEGFTEITLSQYEEWVSEISAFSYYDTVKQTILIDRDDQAAYENAREKAKLRARLKELYFEIEFTNELGESTSLLNSEYAQKLNQYKSMS